MDKTPAETVGPTGRMFGIVAMGADERLHSDEVEIVSEVVLQLGKERGEEKGKKASITQRPPTKGGSGRGPLKSPN